MSISSKAAAAINDRLKFVGLDDAQRKSLAALQPTIAESIGPALDIFYERAAKEAETKKHFANEGHMRHAKEMQIRHWKTLASGKFDKAYVDAVMKIGETHARLGLEPRWYIGGYTLIIEGILRSIVKQATSSRFSRVNGEKLADDITAVMKAAMIDMDHGISVYLETLAEQREAVTKAAAQQKAEQDRALEALDQALERLSRGDLSSDIQASLAQDFADLKQNFNRTVNNLGETFTAVAQAANDTASNSQHLSSATSDMARRAEQQATALEETAAAIEQISTISQQSRERTNEAREIVRQTTAEAERSVTVVGDAVAAMGEIESSSQRITQIIGVIDEISFQTNLLALNAGVEAARAGEAGRGFAVVAQEVRELAQRSATAAKEIRQLIHKSSTDVTNGVALVNRAGDALTTIGTQIASIETLINAIAQSAQEQSQGIGEINSAVGSMDQITQKNAALMEEIDAATHSLMAAGDNLVELMRRFTLKGAVQTSRAPQPMRRSA